MSDYDKGKVTDRERLAADRQKAISQHAADAIARQLSNQIWGYDYSDKQNRALADTQYKQNSRKTSADRFEAQRDLQNATVGLMGSMGQAMNGSSTGNLLSMLNNRNDKDNNTYWSQHQVNQDQVRNSYMDSVNQNNNARMDARNNAEKALRDLEESTASNLNNINPNLYEAPGTGKANFYSDQAWKDYERPNYAQMSGYVQPDNRQIAKRNKVTTGGDYFSQLMNRFNRSN